MMGHQERREMTMDAKELGQIAYKRGLGIETNPFVDGTVEAKSFNKGWKMSHKIISRDAVKSYRASKREMRNEFNS